MINCHSLTWHVPMFIHASLLIVVLLTFMHIIMIKSNVPHIRASMCRVIWITEALCKGCMFDYQYELSLVHLFFLCVLIGM